MEIKLTDQEKRELYHNHDLKRDGWARDQIKAVLLKSEGWTNEAIANVLRIDAGSVRDCLKSYWIKEKKLKQESSSSVSRLISEQLLEDSSLSLFQKILLTTDGTVTALIALYANEAILAKKIEQTITVDEVMPIFEVPAKTPLLKRKILLAGKKKNYLLAEGLFVLERMSKWSQSKLLETDEPIGYLWREEKIETYREIIKQSMAPSEAISQYFDVPSDTPILSRTYLILKQKKPLGMITESFPRSYFTE